MLQLFLLAAYVCGLLSGQLLANEPPQRHGGADVTAAAGGRIEDGEPSAQGVPGGVEPGNGFQIGIQHVHSFIRVETAQIVQIGGALCPIPLGQLGDTAVEVLIFTFLPMM